MRCDDGRVVHSTHAVLAIGSVPNSDGLGLDAAGIEVDAAGYIPINHNCVTNVGHIYAAGDVSGKLPLSSVASMQGRKVAEHVMGLHTRDHRHLDYDKAASAIFTEPEIADVGLAEAEAFASGRKIRVTKVPFTASAKACINNDPRGFVKIISDPATGVVLGGSIVGRHAAELISVIALAVTANLKVSDIVESLLVAPGPPRPWPKRANVKPVTDCRRIGTLAANAGYAMTTTTSPPPTVSPGATLISLTVPAFSADDLVLHLHRLEDDDGLTDLDRLADLDQDLDDRALHRHLDVAAAGGAAGSGPGGPARLAGLGRSRRPAGGRSGHAGRLRDPELDVEALAVDLDRRAPPDQRLGVLVVLGRAAAAGAADAAEVERLLDPLGGVGHGGEVGVAEDGQVGRDGGRHTRRPPSPRGPGSCGRSPSGGPGPTRSSLPTRLS